VRLEEIKEIIRVFWGLTVKDKAANCIYVFTLTSGYFSEYS